MLPGAAPRRAGSASSGVSATAASVSTGSTLVHKAPRSALSGGVVDPRSKQIRAAWAAAPPAAATAAQGVAAAAASAGEEAKQQQQQLPPARASSSLSNGVSPPLSPSGPLSGGGGGGAARPGSAERSVSRPGSAAPSRSSPPSAMLHPHYAAQQSLPAHMSHLHYAHHTFPLFLLQVAVRLFRAKCKDINVQPSRDKERRFVWLVCRQSMGGGASGAAAAAATPPDSNSPTAASEGGGGGGGASMDSSAATGTNGSSGSNLLSFRVPDAALGPHALRELCSFLSTDRRFGHLQLSGNVLGDEGAARLSDLLRVNSTLTSLDVRAAGLGQQAFAQLLDAVADHPSLTSLDASSIKSEGRMFLGAKGCKSLATLLRKNTTLRRLHLANAGFVAEGVGAVARGLAANRTLTALNLSSNDLGQKNVARMGEALQTLTSLEELQLSDNSMGTVGIVLLCDTLRKLENLKRLDLRRNGIGLRGFTVLSDAVGDMISLEELLLDGNALTMTETVGPAGGLGARGQTGAGSMLAAVEGLRNADYRSSDYIESVQKRLHLVDKRVSPRLLLNTALRTLSLNGTALTDRVVEDLAKVLASHKGLHTLLLNGNQITDAGGFALAELVRLSTSLRSLSAADNSIGDDGGAAICMALATPSSQASFLSLRVNNVGKSTAGAVLHALARKRTLHVDLSGGQIPWILYSKLNELSNKNKRHFEASLSGRYQEEWEQLQQRHEYRLQVEEQCVESVEQVSALRETLAALEASQGPFIDREEKMTKALQAEFDAWNHELHECHAAESRIEADLSAHIKELDGRVQALRKNIEVERRFISSAEKLIPQTEEERAALEADIEAGLVDVRRDLRLYLTDRNVEVDGLQALKIELERFVRELESKVKPAGGGGGRGSPNKRSGGAAGAGGARSRSNSRPASGRRQRSPSPPKGKATRPPSASPSASNTRPNSATAAGRKGPVVATPLATPNAKPRNLSASSSSAAPPKVAGKTPAPSSGKKKGAAAAAGGGTGKKKKATTKTAPAEPADPGASLLDAMSPRVAPTPGSGSAGASAPLSPTATTDVDAAGSALVALQLAQANASSAPS